MFSVYLAGSLPEAHLMVERLRQCGIEAVIRNRELQGALGELPMTLLPDVCVLREADQENARLQIAAVVNNYDPSSPEIACGACGELNPSNFELCWKCRADLQTLA